MFLSSRVTRVTWILSGEKKQICFFSRFIWPDKIIFSFSLTFPQTFLTLKLPRPLLLLNRFFLYSYACLNMDINQTYVAKIQLSLVYTESEHSDIYICYWAPLPPPSSSSRISFTSFPPHPFAPSVHILWFFLNVSFIPETCSLLSLCCRILARITESFRGFIWS